MMTNKTSKRRRASIIYGVFAVVLIALTLYISLRKSDRMQYALPEMPLVESGSIVSVSIERGSGDRIEISRENGAWKIVPEAYEVDPKAIEDMVEALVEFRISDLVSTSEYYDGYELDQAHALRITAADANSTVRAFDMGKRAPSYNHTYIRLDGDPNVYHAVSDLRRIFDKQKDNLRNKQVFSFAEAEVIRIGVALPGEEFQIFKSSTEIGSSDRTSEPESWIASNEEEWAPEKVEELLNRIDDLSCSSFIDGVDIDLGTPQLTLQIHTAEQQILYIFDKDDTGYRARSSQNPYPFYLSSWQGDSILETFVKGNTGDQ